MQERTTGTEQRPDPSITITTDGMFVPRPAWCRTDEQWEEYIQGVQRWWEAYWDGFTAARRVFGAASAEPKGSAVTVTELRAPEWATMREDSDGGIRWSHETSVEFQPDSIEPDAPNATLGITAVVNDEMGVSESGSLEVVRGQVEVFIEDQRMTPQQAVALADAVRQVVESIEAAR